jgi:hypothetical protein
LADACCDLYTQCLQDPNCITALSCIDDPNAVLDDCKNKGWEPNALAEDFLACMADGCSNECDYSGE